MAYSHIIGFGTETNSAQEEYHESTPLGKSIFGAF